MAERLRGPGHPRHAGRERPSRDRVTRSAQTVECLLAIRLKRSHRAARLASLHWAATHSRNRIEFHFLLTVVINLPPVM